MPPETPTRSHAIRVVLWAIGTGLVVTLLAGSTPFGLLLPLNAEHHPEIPWLAVGELVFVLGFLTWLSGWGPPRSTAKARSFHLRLWRREEDRPGGSGAAVLPIIGLIIAIDLFYILASNAAGPRALPDVSGYPTTSIRISALIMGALLSGVGEEAGFRGVMQSQLERFGPTVAIAVTSVMFAAAHLTHGWSVVPLMPGYFLLSVLYGLLAYRTGSILPGMALHALGDLAVAYFVTLGGHSELLFA